MEEICLFDPQTSGGLLISVAKEDANRLLKDIEALNLPCGIVGTIKPCWHDHKLLNINGIRCMSAAV